MRLSPRAALLLAALMFGAGAATALWWAWRDDPGHARGDGAAWTVCFTPGEDCTALIVSTIGQARREVLVQAYSFTSPPVAQALERAGARGVRVRVILDESQVTAPHSQGERIHDRQVEVTVDDISGIAHNKVMVIDGATVITGSFNFTRAAQERNAENLLVLRDTVLAARYAENWRRRRALSEDWDSADRPSAANDNARGESGEARRASPRREAF